MSDPIVVYDGLSVTIPAGTNHNAQIVVNPVPTDMWYSWLSGQNDPEFVPGGNPSAPIFTPWITASVVTVTGGSSPILSIGSRLRATSFVAGLSQFNQPAAFGAFTQVVDLISSQAIVVEINSNDPVNDVTVAGLSLSLVMNQQADGSPEYTSDWEGTPPEVFGGGGGAAILASENITSALPGTDSIDLEIDTDITVTVQGQTIPTPRPILFTSYWTAPVNPFFSVGGEFSSSIGTVFMYLWDTDGNVLGTAGTISNNLFPGPGLIYGLIPANAVYWALFTATGEPVDGGGDIVPAGDSTLHIDFYGIAQSSGVLHSFYGNLAFDSLVFTVNGLAPTRSANRVTVIG